MLADIVKRRLRFVNRNAGSGTRLWLDAELRRLRIPSGMVNGYDTEVNTHTEAALLIELGKADVSLGLQAAAHQHNLDFVPLTTGEDYILPLSSFFKQRERRFRR